MMLRRWHFGNQPSTPWPHGRISLVGLFIMKDLIMGAVMGAWLLAGCGTMTSSVPVYPGDWPARVIGAGAVACPEISGIYAAVSEPAAPLVYPAGGAPKEAAFLVPLPYLRVDAPQQLGRRNLAWHLASRFEADEQLTRFSNVIAAGHADTAWVRLMPPSAGIIKVVAGVGGKTLVTYDLLPRDRRKSELWTYQHGYTCRDGKLLVRGVFPVPKEEQWPEVENPVAAGLFTFMRAEDGSLVMLESVYYANGAKEISFQKWWRWRRLGP
jgi:hypothetical protein